MITLIIYLIGCLVCFVIATFITLNVGSLTIGDLALHVVIIALSWLGVFCYVASYIIQNYDKVIWKKKRMNKNEYVL